MSGTSRREFFRFAGLVGAALAGWWQGLRRGAYGQVLAGVTVRSVAPGDEAGLVQCMRSCVASADAFHGYCEGWQWTRSWAEEVVRQRPGSLVAIVDGEVVGYCDAPDRPPKGVEDPRVDRYRKAYWCGAAGVREDLLGKAEAEKLFKELLRRSFEQARALGYEYVRSAAPFLEHPHFRRPFGDYAGMEVSSFEDADGKERYLLVWRLEEAVVALEGEEKGL